MHIKQRDLKSIQKRFPSEKKGWKSTWSGMYYSEQFRSQVHTSKVQKDHHVNDSQKAINSGNFESMCMLSILENIHKRKITFMELGAGWGAQTAEVNGIVRNNIINTEIEEVECFAVEAEPFHFKWMQQMLLYNRIQAVSLFGAVDKDIGLGKFRASIPSGDSYGQSLNTDGNLTVPTFSVDYLVNLYKIQHIDIIHMDVQGAEHRVVEGAKNSINAGIVDVFVIGTHSDHLHKPIRDLLSGYDCIVDMKPKSGLNNFKGFKDPINIAVDGLMVFGKI